MFSRKRTKTRSMEKFLKRAKQSTAPVRVSAMKMPKDGFLIDGETSTVTGYYGPFAECLLLQVIITKKHGQQKELLYVKKVGSWCEPEIGPLQQRAANLRKVALLLAGERQVEELHALGLQAVLCGSAVAAPLHERQLKQLHRQARLPTLAMDD